MIVCPACKSTDYYVTGATAPGFVVEVAGEPFYQRDYAVRECSFCGLLYRTNPAAPEVLSRYYAIVDYKKWEIPAFYPPERWIRSNVLARLRPGTRVLDFGCSSGRLLSDFESLERFGFEINPCAAAEAKRKGLCILNEGQLARGDLNPFGAIILVDVFEHLRDPVAHLEHLVRLLRSGGLLVVASGNGDAPACRRDPAQFWYFRTIEHLLMLTQKHIGYLARTLRLRIRTAVEICHYDFRIRQRAVEHAQDFAYWQFRRRTMLWRTLLTFVPKVRRARRWAVAPTFTASRDHVVVVFEKAE
jgi:SAM-dependent methyltransferase